MKDTPARTGAGFTWAAAYALAGTSVLVVAGAIGISLWNGGYGIVGGLLLLAAAGGAGWTVWMVVGSLRGGGSSAPDITKRD